MLLFALASLTPAAVIAAAAILGGVWPVLALLSITVLVFFLDKVVSWTLPEDQEHDGEALSILLAATHLALLPLLILTVSSGAYLTLVDKMLLVAAAGLWFGQISNSNAHELIHKSSVWPRRIGRLLYATLLYGHHATAHVRVHHVHAATDADPNSARVGENFWAFAVRCAISEFRDGLKAENAMRARAAAKRSALSHPYVQDLAVSAATLGIAFGIAGWMGVATLVAMSTFAALQLMLSDYVQHYGLRRRILANGKPEPIGPRHSWNAPKWYSSAMMLNAPRHSDHHMHPAKSFPALEIDDAEMPMLPQSLPVMAVIALFPPFWHYLMDQRAQRWRLVDEVPHPRRARDISREILGKARTASVPTAKLPDIEYDTPRKRPSQPQPDPNIS